MSGRPPSEITRLLHELSDEDRRSPATDERLMKLVYEELHRTASALMARERAGHTLQPTALVHEAYLRLVQGEGMVWTDRAQFLGVAARCMRQILVDHARGRAAAKRGGDRQRVTLDEGLISGPDEGLELVLLDDALRKLSGLDERVARVAEMRLFGGMTVDETAHALGVSKRTVDGDWQTARLWLSRELQGA